MVTTNRKDTVKKINEHEKKIVGAVVRTKDNNSDLAGQDTVM